MNIIQVGYGYWGKSWVNYIQEQPGCTLRALVAHRPEILARARVDCGLTEAQCLLDFDEALQLEADVVLIVLPHHMHGAYIKKAVDTGKHVLVEKPLCDDFNEALELATFLAGRRERVWVSQNYRYRPQLWRMQKSFQSGAMGTAAWAEISYRAGMTTDPEEHRWNIQGWRGEQANMLCVEVGIHHYDMLRFLSSSDVRSVYCTGWTPKWGISGGIESVFVNLDFESGFKALYSAHSCSVGAPTDFQGNWRVQGTRGLVTWSSGQDLEVWPAADHPGFLPSEEEAGYPGFDRAGVLSELGRALAGEVTSLPQLQDNLKSLAIPFAVLRSARERRAVTLAELFEEGVR